MVIRPYVADDRQLVAALDVVTQVDSMAIVQLTEGRFTWSESPLPTARTKRHELAGYLDEAPRSWDEGFVAVVDARVVGFAATSLSTWNRRLVLEHMYVDRAARGRGVGTALLQAAMSGHGARGAQHVWLETQTDNVPAMRAYERMGFRVVGLDQSMYGDRPGAGTAVFMSQPLAPERTA